MPTRASGRRPHDGAARERILLRLEERLDELYRVLHHETAHPTRNRPEVGGRLSRVAELLGDAEIDLRLRCSEEVDELQLLEGTLAEAIACEGIVDSLRGRSLPTSIQMSLAVIGTEVGVVVRSTGAGSSGPRRRRVAGLRRIETALSEQRGVLDVFRTRGDLVFFALFPLDPPSAQMPTTDASTRT